MASPDRQAPTAPARYSTPFTRSDYRLVLLIWLLAYIVTPLLVLGSLGALRIGGSGSGSDSGSRFGDLGAAIFFAMFVYSYIVSATPFVIGGCAHALAIAGMRRLARWGSRALVA